VTDTIASPASSTRAPRTARKISFFHAEPVARWLSVVLVVYALILLLEQLRYVVTHFTGDITLDLMRALDAVLSYAVIGMIGWRSTWASLASITCLVTSALSSYYGTVIITVCVVTIAVVATATQRFIATHLLAYLVWALVATNLEGPFNDSLFWSILNALIISALLGGATRYFRLQRRKNEQRVRDLEILNERLREDERQALARDLHDVVAHELTLITMQTMSRRRSEDVGELHQVLETVEDAARSALHELRVLLRLLRNENDGEHPRDVTGAGLAIGSLAHVVTSLAASLKDLRFDPQVTMTGDLEGTPTTTRGTAARILQEAVTNIIKYAPRDSVCGIAVTADEHELRLLVTNPLPRTGQQPSSELSSGLGLRGIAERVSLLGGEVESGPVGGQWVLDARLPVDGRDAL
jgi:signal transduction histidine kinase